jgi:hypothetical protein
VDTTAGLRLGATQKKGKNLGQALDSRRVVPIIGRSFSFNVGDKKEVIMTSKRNCCPVYEVCVRDIPET